MESSRLDPTLLPTFLTVLELGSVSEGARKLHLSQPAVTAQIRRLEEELGVAVFARSVKGVTPTAAGLRLADYARRLESLLNEAQASIHSAARGAVSSLELAASTTIAAHILPPLLASFRARHAGVSIALEVHNTKGVIELVKSGRIPLGLVEGRARAAGVHLEPFVDDEIVAVMAKSAPFCLRSSQDLAAVPLLFRESGSGTRAVVQAALAQAGVELGRRRPLDLELAATEVILGAAAAGLGVAFVSRLSARAHLRAGLVQLVPGLDLKIRRTFRWALPAGGLSGGAELFYQHALHSRDLALAL